MTPPSHLSAAREQEIRTRLSKTRTSPPTNYHKDVTVLLAELSTLRAFVEKVATQADETTLTLEARALLESRKC